MAQIDIRSAVQMRQISELLLRVAEKPLQFVDQLSGNWADFAKEPTIAAAMLARQASAAVICNCVVELWSRTVAYLHALEPEFPLYPKNVIRFIDESRLPFLSYVSLYYSLCRCTFEGTSAAEKMKTLVDLRHELQHDKPETANEYSTERVNKLIKWRKRLEPLVGKTAILWQPNVRLAGPADGFQILGEPVVMKFMKYPIAKWALDATAGLSEQMSLMLYNHFGQKKLCPERQPDELFDPRFSTDQELLRLWQCGE